MTDPTRTPTPDADRLAALLDRALHGPEAEHAIRSILTTWSSRPGVTRFYALWCRAQDGGAEHVNGAWRLDTGTRRVRDAAEELAEAIVSAARIMEEAEQDADRVLHGVTRPELARLHTDDRRLDADLLHL